MSDKIKYRCSSCGFRFSRSPQSNLRLICPNCGKSSVLKDLESSAQDLLDSVSEISSKSD